MAVVVEKELFDHVALISQTNHEIINTVMSISFHDVPQEGFPTNVHHWFRF